MRRKILPFINRTYVQPFGITCVTEVLPPVDFDYCEPEIRLSEIRRIFITRIDAVPFIDWTSRGEWEVRVDNGSDDINAIREFYVIGDKPQPTSIKKAISMQRTKIMRKDHMVNATIDEVNETNHKFIQSLEKGVPYMMWYETWGQLMFGGNKGIAIILTGDMVLPKGNGEIMVYLLTASWNAKRTEDRCESPIFFDSGPLLSEDGDTLLGEDGGTLIAG